MDYQTSTFILQHNVSKLCLETFILQHNVSKHGLNYIVYMFINENID